MKHLKKALGVVALAVVVALGGCTRIGQDIETAWNAGSAISSATIDAREVFTAAKLFDGAQLFAANYLELRRCTAANRPVCREPGATPIIKGAVHSGRIARNELKAQLRYACAEEFAAGVECSKGIPVASYRTLVAATRTINDATAAYHAAVGQ